jgi:hypothetical protein
MSYASIIYVSGWLAYSFRHCVRSGIAQCTHSYDTYKYVHTDTHTYTHEYSLVHTHMHKHACTHKHTHMHTHTHSHTHTNTHTDWNSPCTYTHSGDEVYNYFEPEMDWSPFSVLLKESQIPQINTIIENISLEQRKKMQVTLTTKRRCELPCLTARACGAACPKCAWDRHEQRAPTMCVKQYIIYYK